MSEIVEPEGCTALQPQTLAACALPVVATAAEDRDAARRTAATSQSPAAGQASLLLQLPNDALLAICVQLPPSAVAALHCCCRPLREVTGGQQNIFLRSTPHDLA